MQTFRQRYKGQEQLILAGFLIPVIIVTAFLGSTFYDLQYAYKTRNQNDFLLKQMSILELLLDDMQDLEAGTRGYIISNDSSFLHNANQAIGNIPKHRARLLTTPFAREDSADIIRLNELVYRKLYYSTVFIAYKKNGRQPDLQLFRQSKAVMDEIRHIILSIENKNRHLLAASSKRQPYVLQRALFFFSGGAITLFLFLIWQWRKIRSGFERQIELEHAVKKASEQIQDLYDNAPCGYHCINEAGVITEINSTEANWIGYPKSYLLGRNIREFLTPEGVISLEDMLRLNKNTYDRETDFIKKDGQLLPVLITTTLHHESEGKQFRSAIFDQSKIQEMRGRIAALAQLVEESGDAIITADEKFEITGFNKGAVQLFGYSSEEMTGRNISEIGGILFADSERDIIRQQVARNYQWSGDTLSRRKDGVPLIVQVTVTMVRSSDNVTGFIIVCRDNTSQVKELESLKLFNRELEKTVELRAREVSNLIDRLTDGFVALDDNLRILYFNDHLKDLLGLSADPEKGKLITDYLPESNIQFRNIFLRTLHDDQVQQFEILIRADLWVQFRLYPDTHGLSVLIHNITPSKKYEASLRASESRYRMLFVNNPVPLWVFGREGMKIIDVNEAAVLEYGYSREEFLKLTALDLIIPDEHRRLDELIPSPHKLVDYGIWKHRRKNGTIINVHIFTHEIPSDDDKMFMAMGLNVTGEVKAKEELQQLNAQLRNLAVHLQTIREEERAHLAREVHDELGQLLTGIKIDIASIRKRIDNQPELTLKVNSALELIDLTVKTVRRIAGSLRPAMLDDLGIAAAIEWQCSDFNSRTGINCTFKNESGIPIPNEERMIILLRVCQESMTNIIRHANADKVEVSLKYENSLLILTVRDNGKGFDTRDTYSGETLGVIGMRERVIQSGGLFSIESIPGNGTVVTAGLPFKAEHYENSPGR